MASDKITECDEYLMKYFVESKMIPNNVDPSLLKSETIPSVLQPAEKTCPMCNSDITDFPSVNCNAIVYGYDNVYRGILLELFNSFTFEPGE